MTKRQPTLENYTGSLADLVISAVKSKRDMSWAEIAREIRREIGDEPAPRRVRPASRVPRPARRMAAR